MPHPSLALLFSTICDWLRNGRHLTADVCHYADTVLGGSDAATLRDALAADHPDHDTFAEFLLFPDLALHETVDMVLHPAVTACQPSGDGQEDRPPACPVFGTEDEAALVAALQQTAQPCTLHLTRHDSITFPVPEHIWLDIVRRLHLTTAIPQPLQCTITRLQPEATARFTRIRLRTCRLPLPGPGAGLLMRFLEQYPCTDPAYRPTLDFWLHFLSTLPITEPQRQVSPTAPPVASEPATKARKAGAEHDSAFTMPIMDDAWHILHARHQRLVRGLRQAQEFSEKLQRFSMELMMMQGAQAPFIHEDDAREQIRIMERVSLAVFGKPAALGDEMREAHYGSVYPETDMEGVLRTLSLLDK